MAQNARFEDSERVCPIPDAIMDGQASYTWPVDIASMSLETVRVLDLLGVAANALLAGALARSLKFDVIGFMFLGIVTGLGGGILRDTLIQHGTPYALTDPAYLAAAMVGSLVSFLYPTTGRWWLRSAKFIDAVALGAWGAVGAQRALMADLSPLAAILLGTITAVGGGIIRDVLVGRTPIIFGGSTLYATSATVAAGTAVVLYLFVVPPGWGGLTSLAGMLIGGTMCLLAYRYGWSLPGARNWRLWGRRGA